MKKLLSAVVCLLLLCTLAIPALADGEAPQITMQPQNYHYPEYAVAVYSVKAIGKNLTATWYLEYQGKTYNLSDNKNSVEPWEGYAGENYGPMEEGPNTFSWFFGGIEEELNGAEIWCVLEDGHYDVTTERAVITVQGEKMPPEIRQMPASLEVTQGSEAEVRCVAASTDDSQLAFAWYETASGKLQDLRAIDGETGDYLLLDTKTAGTRYYVCCITSSAGGMAYSSVLPVTVKAGGKAPTFMTKKLPQGTVGEDYGFILETDDHAGEFTVSYNPGGANDFEKTGLKLSVEGMLMGKLTKAGKFTFTVCVSNAYGEDYGVLTLEVVEPDAATTPSTTPATIPVTPPESTPGTQTETIPGTTAPQSQPQQPDAAPAQEQLPWWALLIIALGGIGAGVGIAIAIARPKKNS